jgi:hypothetical protein
VLVPNRLASGCGVTEEHLDIAGALVDEETREHRSLQCRAPIAHEVVALEGWKASQDLYAKSVRRELTFHAQQYLAPGLLVVGSEKHYDGVRFGDFGVRQRRSKERCVSQERWPGHAPARAHGDLTTERARAA